MTGYRVYQGKQVEGSGPLGLVLLTYEALYKSLARACRAIEAGDLAAEADHTSRSIEALIELSSSLNADAGGDLSKNLGSLYAYMTRRLSDGLCTCSTEHVDEVAQLVQTLRDGWEQLSREQTNKTANSHASSSYRSSESLGAVSYGSLQAERHAA